jgi:hypothetical protein
MRRWFRLPLERGPERSEIQLKTLSKTSIHIIHLLRADLLTKLRPADRRARNRLQIYSDNLEVLKRVALAARLCRPGTIMYEIWQKLEMKMPPSDVLEAWIGVNGL